MVEPSASSHESNASNEEIPTGTSGPVVEPLHPPPARAPTQLTAPIPAAPRSPPIHSQISYQGLSSAPSVAGSNNYYHNPAERHLRIRVAHPPQLQGQIMTPTVQVDRATGQLRLDLGGGQVVTIPSPPQHPNLPQGSSLQPLPQVVSIHRQAASGGGPPTGQLPSHRSGFQTVNVVRSVHLPPLLPIPVTNQPSSSVASHAPDNNNNDDDDDESLARFKCVVCYEFMKEPVGCPSDTCSARFCQSCFVRAAQESSNQSTTSTTNVTGNTATRPKCPMCRVEFTYYIKDSALRAELMQQPGGPTVACRHAGCPETKLPLALVQDHERQCSYEALKCRYVSFGCPWVGRRGDLATHEMHDCSLHKVSALVQKVREMELDYSNRLNILQQQTTGALQMLEVYRQNIQREGLKSNNNLFDIVHFVHVITCSTQHFLQTRDRWLPLYRSDEGRAAVTNFLVLVPTVLSCGGMALKGVQTLPRLLLAVDHGSGTSMSADSFNVLLEDSVMGILIGIMLGLMLLANFIDSASSIQWTPFANLPGGGKPPLMCDLMALCLFIIDLTLIDYFGSPYQSVLIWTMLCVTTTVFPALVWTMSHRSTHMARIPRSPSSHLTMIDISTKARSCEPVFFGLRFSIMASLFGIGPMMDAAALTLLVNSLYRSLPLRGLQHGPPTSTSAAATPQAPPADAPPAEAPPASEAATTSAPPAPRAPPSRLVAMVFLSTHKNCFLEGLTRPTLVAYLWVRVGMILTQPGLLIHWNNHNDGDLHETMAFPWTMILLHKGTTTTVPFWNESMVVVATLLESFVAWVIFGWISVGLNAGMTMGIKWGHWIMDAAEQTMRRRLAATTTTTNHGERPDGNEYHLLGVASFGLWVSLLAMLVCLH